MKGHGCADGRSQCTYINKEDASAPTVTIESIMLTCVIDAAEQCDFATINIPGAFMQVDMDKLIYIKLEGKMVDLLVKIEPKLYRKYVPIEKGRPILYVELKKLYMEHYKRLSCSGKSSANNWKTGASKSTLMTGMLQTKP